MVAFANLAKIQINNKNPQYEANLNQTTIISKQTIYNG